MELTAPIIAELGGLLLAAAAAGWFARRAGLPSVVGYLVVGLVVSPFTPGFVAHREQLHLLADIGVILLLFEVGIEIDVMRLRREHRGLFLAAPLQTLLTTAIGAAAGLAAGLTLVAAVLIGLCVALSSSVVIVNITRSSRRTTDRATEHGLLGWSVLQDLTGVVVAAGVIAVIGASSRSPLVALAGIGAFVAVAVATAWTLPRVLRRLQSEHDLFLIVSVASGLSIAGLGGVAFGIPMALAAFVAGLTISESHAANEARRRLLPFRDLFAVLFFVSIGTLIDPDELGRGLGWLALLLGVLVLGKVLVAYLLARVTRLEARPWQLAVGLAQVGEFSFVLASVGLAAGVIERPLYAAMLSAVALTIGVSTVVVRFVQPGRSPLPEARTR
ncbi:MAG: cation:proton antiporter [Chloroflexota bacterium]|nr:cation:proton antiporter [Chloroflexota bacterium]